VRAVVLLDESQVVAEDGGRITTTRRRAVRILNREGRSEAVGRVVYQTDTGKVRSVRAWTLWPAGEVRRYGKDAVIDVEVAPNDVYNEVRAQVVAGTVDANPGTVFAFETVLEDRSVFTQFDWSFQDDLPVATSRFTVTAPEGWRADGVVYNRDPLEPTRAGLTTTWELRDLPAIETEPYGPALSSIAPWLAVSLVPAAGARTGIGKTFESWSDVSRWLSELADPQAVVADDLREKARALTSNAKSELERIEAVGRFVQGIRYVSIQTGVGRGGGYRPHAAPEVLSKAYGDCKDKATLMRAMLKAVGTEAFPVAIYSGDRYRVRADWPSPQQFNHAIVAVRVADNLGAPAAETYPGLGRLLFFDPTDEHTPVGLLPQDQEGSRALLVSRAQGALLRMPQSPPEANRVERRLELALTDDGSLEGTVDEKAFGHAATTFRRRREAASGDDRKEMEAWISRSGSGARLGSLDSKDEADGSARVTVSFSTPRYAKSMGGALLMVKPTVLPGRNPVWLPEGSRKYAVVLDAQSFDEVTRIRLPPSFRIDEMPRPTQSRTAFGIFSSSCAAEEAHLVCRRSLSVSAGSIPSEQYKETRTFFAWVNSAGAEPVVLARR
jgi:hypothetical protein